LLSCNQEGKFEKKLVPDLENWNPIKTSSINQISHQTLFKSPENLFKLGYEE